MNHMISTPFHRTIIDENDFDNITTSKKLNGKTLKNQQVSFQETPLKNNQIFMDSNTVTKNNLNTQKSSRKALSTLSTSQMNARLNTPAVPKTLNKPLTIIPTITTKEIDIQPEDMLCSRFNSDKLDPIDEVMKRANELEIPMGNSTDALDKDFFDDLLEQEFICELLDFDNN